MKLYELLTFAETIYIDKAYHDIRDDKAFYKALGRVDMCDELLKLLSDEILKMEVETRIDVWRGEP